ncbi:unnamed protein product [Dovyalis caffra]|uniref:Uncharacterized protein n=1 Tax=Dovyalis caffra TaxID=77055 RepID=A0AAV1SNI4_9ROSI|nr:unnamed protein product [Dovyalis caffra]
MIELTTWNLVFIQKSTSSHINLMGIVTKDRSFHLFPFVLVGYPEIPNGGSRFVKELLDNSYTRDIRVPKIPPSVTRERIGSRARDTASKKSSDSIRTRSQAHKHDWAYRAQNHHLNSSQNNTTVSSACKALKNFHRPINKPSTESTQLLMTFRVTPVITESTRNVGK